MSGFLERVRRFEPTADEALRRRWIYVPYDRLNDAVGPLGETEPEDAVVVLMEARGKGSLREYHKKKLTLVLSAMRHFALEQAERGCRVVYGSSPTSFSDGLLLLQERWGWKEIVVNRPAEREMRVELREAKASRGLRIRAVRDTAWLTTTEDFEGVFGKAVGVQRASDEVLSGEGVVQVARGEIARFEEKPGKAIGAERASDEVLSGEGTVQVARGEIARFEKKPGEVVGVERASDEVLSGEGVVEVARGESARGEGAGLAAKRKGDGAFGRQRLYLMDRFYRAMRRKTGYLMKGAQPVGGQWSYDSENRKPYRGEVPIPERPSYPPDEITQEVMALVKLRFADHFGVVEGFDLPVTRAQALDTWQFALENLLPYFGPWEDAMSVAHPDLFHSLTSSSVNITLLRPEELLMDTVQAFEEGKIPLASTEGFVRQILGWREFMRHIHEATDGYRTIQEDGAPSFLDAHRKLPPVYWGVKSGMRCMDTVVGQVVEKGWSHHITRLMVLSNLATLCGFSPRELTDWFWFGYIDAYDWVVEPNVLGMATFGDGGLTATKPYVSGAAYINRMSDYCGKCVLNPKKNTGPGSCPFTAMYWSFLERHEDKLAGNQRMRMPLNTMLKKSGAERAALRERAEEAIGMLERGEVVR